MINLTQELKSLTDGQPVMQQDPDGKKDSETGVVKMVPMTLRDAILGGLLMSDKPGDDLAGKVAKFKLASRVTDKDEIELEAADITLIKEKVAVVHGTLVTGRVCELLDPASVA